jgi:phosphoglycolate phosphatase-like HAD superfamily hydrolase
MTTPRLRAALFDVDGTLTAPADPLSARALQLALAQGYGLPKIDLSLLRREGLTSREAVIALAERHGIESEVAIREADEVMALRNIHYGALVADDRGAHKLTSSPYVAEFLAALREAHVHLGLMTGNSEFIARTKLWRAGLDPSLFAVGAFGDTPTRREDLAATAIERMHVYLAALEVEEVLVVGDAPADIRAGADVGCRTLAVASGSFSANELNACGPDLLVDSLSPTPQLMRYVLGGSRR